MRSLPAPHSAPRVLRRLQPSSLRSSPRFAVEADKILQTAKWTRLANAALRPVTRRWPVSSAAAAGTRAYRPPSTTSRFLVATAAAHAACSGRAADPATHASPASSQFRCLVIPRKHRSWTSFTVVNSNILIARSDASRALIASTHSSRMRAASSFTVSASASALLLALLTAPAERAVSGPGGRPAERRST